MELVELRQDFQYRTQRRKEQARSTWNQHQIAGADFETKDGFPHIFSWTVFDGKQYVDRHFLFGGTPKEPDMFVSANGGNRHPAFNIERFCEIVKATGNYSDGGNGKRQKPQEMFFFNLSYDASAILKTLEQEAIEWLLVGNECVIDTQTNNIAHNVARIKIDNPNYGKKDRRKKIQVWALTEEDSWSYLPFNRYIKVSYLPKKHLMLEPLKYRTGDVKWGRVDCWDIRPFCGGGSLNRNAKTILKESKLDFTADEMQLIGSLSREGNRFSVKNHDRICEYAEKDSNLTARIAWNVVSNFESNGVRMKRPYSPASVAERACLDRCSIPTMNDMVRQHNESVLYSWSSYQGGWFESCGSGYWSLEKGGVRAFDITSAYPHVMWWLPDMTYGEWIGTPYGDPESEAQDYLDRFWKPYSLSYFEAEVIFPEGLNIYPAAKKSELAGCLMNPRIVYGFFTGDEIKEFEKWGADIGIERWSAFIPMNDHPEAPDVEAGIRYPFRPFIQTFYGGKLAQDELKKSGSPKYDEDKRSIYKLMINSLYGKTVQALPDVLTGFRKTGQLWNPFYASVITAGCRSRIAEIIRINGNEKVLAVNTDGIIFKNEGELTIPENPMPVYFDGELVNLGDWENDGDGALLLMMSGVYSIIKEAAADMVLKSKTTFRGAYSMFIDHRDDEGELLSNLYGEDWLTFCTKYHDRESVSRNAEINPTMRPYTLGEAKVRGDYQLTNVFRIVELTITANGDSNKRRWHEKPATFGDLAQGWFESFPHEVMI